ncbi:MAG: 2-amino-4-hydroxy-6-hydroxymethyldihydropteridine diphosphokinase [Bacteroidaceae bacterium]|jgi:2-amino-4-hydroxy-6-hydroxymethyldihydropteridine diphosphokinase|nr:2-amino-4-hydroxy-6-hydroxymethyldihydropteridine diphosphokinase [Bacteroidaceae bacterium]MBQ9884521.1 2-amino-4-hydroxy-6-hydroxymethyldihydropteridine diphosphokinase [Bacteroidaceae bacterium]MBR1940738.1 2-amino-4-hydroxy-6-hydroxymethyldihydropteridine diphosphokinase [Bacteroidaceae bacterium]MBR2161593.1 2-amino-4-hydroxy-6-hydroxymethyldihydropteridine diphosphokinase [Bacteroidaceae bacterium]MBR3014107.1 2-amino-4-hydroxy-6-hydroxymethyldihydropteridine diphosphokinase [Bacteroid
MSRIYLGIGSNLGDKEQNIKTALKLVEERVGKIIIQSSICQTMPWGFHSDNIFFNAAACVETNLTPMQVLSVIKMIEMEMGRTSKSSQGMYADRIIDLDLLFYEDQVINEVMLTVPHPLLQYRMFVLMPMTEIAPDLVHPVLKLPMRELLTRLVINE